MLSEPSSDVGRDPVLIDGTLPGGMIALKLFQLDGNRELFGTFPDTSALANLSMVTASGCNFTKAAKQSAALQHLDLSFNQLDTLPDIGACSRLQILRLQNNKVSHWPPAGVAAQRCSGSTMMPRFEWKQLQQLVVSDNPLSADAQQFADSLSYLDALVDLQAANCSLFGAIMDFEVRKENNDPCIDPTQPWVGFAKLRVLDLSGNGLQAIQACPPNQLEQARLASNSLSNIVGCWLQSVPDAEASLTVSVVGNAWLHAHVSQASDCAAGVHKLVADPSRFKEVVRALGFLSVRF